MAAHISTAPTPRPKTDGGASKRPARRGGYDRSKLLAQANAARAKRKRKKAIELYRSVLAHEPDNPELHRKLGALCAETRQRKEALVHFAHAVRSLQAQGFLEKAVGLCRQAAGYFPDEAGIWETLAALQMERGRPADAIESLLQGRSRLRGRKRRPQAIRLLQRVRALDPGAVEPQLDLAWLLRATGARSEACRILEDLALRTTGRARRRVCLARLRIAPGPRALLRWLAAAVGARVPR